MNYKIKHIHPNNVNKGICDFALAVMDAGYFCYFDDKECTVSDANYLINHHHCLNNEIEEKRTMLKEGWIAKKTYLKG